MQSDEISRHFDGVFARRSLRELGFAIDRYGDYDVGATLGLISYITQKDTARHKQILARSMRSAGMRPKILLEVGCGIGGYAAYLAEQLRVSTIGIDLSSVAVARAICRFRRNDNVGFIVAAAENIPLTDSTVAGAISIDMLYLSDRSLTTMLEVRRVLMPGASIVFTVLQSDEALGTVAIEWEKLLTDAGFNVTACRNLTADWRSHMLTKHSWRWHRRDLLRSILGKWVEPELAVSRAMLGLDGCKAIAMSTARFEYVARRDPNS